MGGKKNIFQMERGKLVMSNALAMSYTLRKMWIQFTRRILLEIEISILLFPQPS